MRLIPTLIACLLPFAATADTDLPNPVTDGPVMEAQFSLPAPLLRQIKADPVDFIDTVAALIAAYGVEDAITSEQVDTSIALTRAKARTAAILPLIAADLNGDGAVTREEVVAAEAAASATARARIERNFRAADADGDAVVSALELADYGATAAAGAFSPARMSGLKVLMGFDSDADGRVTVAEVRMVLNGMMS